MIFCCYNLNQTDILCSLGGIDKIMAQTKRQNAIYSAILHTIYTKHIISRIDIANETGMTPATVSLNTAKMIESGLIQEVGEEATEHDGVGRKKILLSVRPAHSYYIGAEIAEKFLSFVLTDNVGTLIEKKTVPAKTGVQADAGYFITHCLDFMERVASYPVKAVGVAIPGHFRKSTRRKILTNNPCWKNFDLGQISSRLPVPVYFSNNVHCMARAESLFYSNPQDGSGNFIFFHLGRGIHCTYMYRSELYSRHNFKIGEIGHTIVRPDGELCECGKRGCLQTCASETWLIKKAKLLYTASPSTYLRQLAANEEEITIRTALSAYRLGDEGVMRLLHTAVKCIGIAISNLNLLIDSDRIFIHGALFDEPELTGLLKQQLDFEPTLLLPQEQKLIIKPFSPFTGAIGAASLCVCRYLLMKE